jgi:hypothetical protein
VRSLERAGSLEEAGEPSEAEGLEEGAESREGGSLEGTGEPTEVGGLEEGAESREGGESRRHWRTYRSWRSRGGCGV